MQKLQVRGILVGGSKRGLRVSDYGQRRIAELFELRFAVEKIIFQHVMRPDHDKTALLEELEGILARMAELSDSGDPVALSSVDLDFHRAVARHSGAELAAQMWEGLAQHLIIVFCRDWSKASDRPGEVRLHQKMIDFLRSGAIAAVDAVLTDHFSEPGLTKGTRRGRETL